MSTYNFNRLDRRDSRIIEMIKMKMFLPNSIFFLSVELWKKTDKPLYSKESNFLKVVCSELLKSIWCSLCIHILFWLKDTDISVLVLYYIVYIILNNNPECSRNTITVVFLSYAQLFLYQRGNYYDIFFQDKNSKSAKFFVTWIYRKS